MVGLGTVINTVAIVAGGLLGLGGGKLMKPRVQETLQKVCGISTLFIGMAGALEKMMTLSEGKIVSGQGMMITVCLALGALIGELINIEALFEQFGEWLKKKTGSAGEASFVSGFVTASLTVSIGAMAIVGSIRDGISGDWSILASKSVLDFIIVLVMTCSLGKGCIFSAIPVLVFEGLMTAGAVLLKPLMTTAALDSLSLVGSILIFSVGVNLVWNTKLRVANFLPALVLAAAASYLPL